MLNVTVTGNENTLKVGAPFNAEFVAHARDLGGRWAPPYWVFDARDEQAVRGACMRCYGHDGHDGTHDQVDVRVTCHEGGHECGPMYSDRTPLQLFGRTVARAFGRDSGAKLGEGVTVQSGGFTSGGSAKNWDTRVLAGTVFTLRDVSRQLVDELEPTEDMSVEVIARTRNEAVTGATLRVTVVETHVYEIDTDSAPDAEYIVERSHETATLPTGVRYLGVTDRVTEAHDE